MINLSKINCIAIFSINLTDYLVFLLTIYDKNFTIADKKTNFICKKRNKKHSV